MTEKRHEIAAAAADSGAAAVAVADSGSALQQLLRSLNQNALWCIFKNAHFLLNQKSFVKQGANPFTPIIYLVALLLSKDKAKFLNNCCVAPISIDVLNTMIFSLLEVLASNHRLVMGLLGDGVGGSEGSNVQFKMTFPWSMRDLVFNHTKKYLEKHPELGYMENLLRHIKWNRTPCKTISLIVLAHANVVWDKPMSDGRHGELLTTGRVTLIDPRGNLVDITNGWARENSEFLRAKGITLTEDPHNEGGRPSDHAGIAIRKAGSSSFLLPTWSTLSSKASVPSNKTFHARRRIENQALKAELKNLIQPKQTRENLSHLIHDLIRRLDSRKPVFDCIDEVFMSNLMLDKSCFSSFTGSLWFYSLYSVLGLMPQKDHHHYGCGILKESSGAFEDQLCIRFTDKAIAKALANWGADPLSAAAADPLSATAAASELGLRDIHVMLEKAKLWREDGKKELSRRVNLKDKICFDAKFLGEALSGLYDNPTGVVVSFKQCSTGVFDKDGCEVTQTVSATARKGGGKKRKRKRRLILNLPPHSKVYINIGGVAIISIDGNLPPTSLEHCLRFNLFGRNGRPCATMVYHSAELVNGETNNDPETAGDRPVPTQPLAVHEEEEKQQSDPLDEPLLPARLEVRSNFFCCFNTRPPAPGAWCCII